MIAKYHFQYMYGWENVYLYDWFVTFVSLVPYLGFFHPTSKRAWHMESSYVRKKTRLQPLAPKGLAFSMQIQFYKNVQFPPITF